MDTRNLTRADIRYIDELCEDDRAFDAGSALDSALEIFGARHGIELGPDEIYEPDQAQCNEIARLAVNIIFEREVYRV